LVRLGYPPAVVFKNERAKYLKAMRKADKGDYGPLGELIARAVTNNLYRFVVPAVAGPARLVPLASLVDPKKGITATALRAAAERGRLRAQKADNGTWLSSKNWVAEYQRNKHKRANTQPSP
ncbi:MAG TPA: Fic family protein, partial [Nocardioides sp.]|nr:Fic family protein [Nocardioides sp.]